MTLQDDDDVVLLSLIRYIGLVERTSTVKDPVRQLPGSRSRPVDAAYEGELVYSLTLHASKKLCRHVGLLMMTSFTDKPIKF